MRNVTFLVHPPVVRLWRKHKSSQLGLAQANGRGKKKQELVRAPTELQVSILSIDVRIC